MSIKSDAIDLLTNLGVDRTDVHSYQVLCLPENIENQMKDVSLIDSGEAIALSKLLREEKIACANSYDLGLETKVSERRSSEHYLGLYLDTRTCRATYRRWCTQPPPR